MRKLLSIAGLMLAFGLIFAGCGAGHHRSEPETTDPNGGTLQGNVSFFDEFSGGNGTLVDAENATITMAGANLPTRTALTGTDGNYIIRQIFAGTYTVTADYSTVNHPYSFGMGAVRRYRLNSGQWTDEGSWVAPGDLPNSPITVSNVTITDNTTTTLDFQLIGY